MLQVSWNKLELKAISLLFMEKFDSNMLPIVDNISEYINTATLRKSTMLMKVSGSWTVEDVNKRYLRVYFCPDVYMNI